MFFQWVTNFKVAWSKEEKTLSVLTLVLSIVSLSLILEVVCTGHQRHQVWWHWRWTSQGEKRWHPCGSCGNKLQVGKKKDQMDHCLDSDPCWHCNFGKWPTLHWRIILWQCLQNITEDDKEDRNNDTHFGIKFQVAMKQQCLWNLINHCKRCQGSQSQSTLCAMVGRMVNYEAEPKNQTWWSGWHLQCVQG